MSASATARLERLAPWVIAGLAAVVFAPSLLNGFVEWDDYVNLYTNEKFRGLGWAQLEWMFTTTLMGHYIPVTWLAFGLDYTLWGLDPVGYHLTNVVLHAANAALFYAIARRLLARALPDAPAISLIAGAALAALFFALHPLRAESVAWVTERRDVLSALFTFTAVLAYLKAADADGVRRVRLLAASVGAFGLALLSKSIAMTLPLVLVVLDVYPLRRLPGDWRAWAAPAVRRVCREKVPFLVLAALAAEVSWWAVARNDFFTSWEKYPILSRAAIAFYAHAFYLEKTLLPVGLSPLYELPAVVDPLDGRFLGPTLLVVALTAGLWLLRRHWPAAAAAWAVYVIALAPVNGFVHAGHQLAHDRYSYLSCLGFAVLLGALPALVARAIATGGLRPALARAIALALPLWLAGLSFLTWSQIQVWRNTETLWAHAVDVQPDCAICQENLGVVLVNQGLAYASIPHFMRALDLRPDFRKAEGSLGLALLQTGRPADAERRLRRALERHPDNVPFLNNLGTALLHQQKYAEALDPLRGALRRKPEEVVVRANLGAALAGLGRSDEAIREFRRAVAIKPDAPEPRVGLAKIYLELGDAGAAREHYEVARRVNPVLAAPLAPAFTSGL
jgi:tetratricopeptide (TPR) repeat protein